MNMLSMPAGYAVHASSLSVKGGCCMLRGVETVGRFWETRIMGGWLYLMACGSCFHPSLGNGPLYL